MFRDKRCEYCQKQISVFDVCRCHLKIELRGHPTVVRETLTRLEQIFELLNVVEGSQNLSPEVTLLVVVKNPEYAGDVPDVFKDANWD
jgi:hypothetical protein